MRKILLVTILHLVFSEFSFAQQSDPILRLNTDMHGRSMRSVSVDENEKFVLTVSDDKTAKLWNATNGDLIRTFRTHIGSGNEGYLLTGKLSSSGDLSLLGGLEGIFVFSSATGELLESIPTELPVKSIEFMGNEKLVVGLGVGAVGGASRSKIIIYEVNSSKSIVNFSKLKELDIPGSNLSNLSVSVGGKIATVLANGEIRLYDNGLKMTANLQPVRGKFPSSCDFSPDETKLAVGSKWAKELDPNYTQNSIDIYSTDNLRFIHTPIGASGLWNVKFSKNGMYLYAGGTKWVVKNQSYQRFIRQWEQGGIGFYSDLFTNDGTTTTIATGSSGSVYYGSYMPCWGRVNPKFELLYQKSNLTDTYSFGLNPAHRKFSVKRDGSAFVVSTMNYQQLKVDDVHYSLEKRRVIGNKQNYLGYDDLKQIGKRINTNKFFHQSVINIGESLVKLQSGEKVQSWDLSSDESQVLIGASYSLMLYDNRGNRLRHIDTYGGENFMVKLMNDSLAYTATSSGVISCYNLNIEDRYYLVSKVLKGSSADLSGLMPGDIIVKINGQTFESQYDLKDHIKGHSSLIIELLRNGERIELNGQKSGPSFGFVFTAISDSRLFDLFIHPSTKDWILYTPDGYFDCSPGAEKYVGWHVNQGKDKAALFYPLSQFYDKYYTPNLGMRLLNGENIGNDESSLAKGFALPPTVKILSPGQSHMASDKTLTVKVSAQDQGGGVDEIRLYHNGKMVTTTQRGFKAVGETQEFTISLVAGENRIKATAFNDDRTESIPDEIMVYYEGTQKTSDLHMLVVGLNAYRNPKYNLNYALTDAQAFSQSIESKGAGIFDNVNVTFVQDSDATREGITQAFEQIKTQADAEDVFVFYYAGHGVMSMGEQSEFYLIPYEVTRLYAEDDMLRGKGISASELQEFSRTISAQKQLFVLDACQSGGMTEVLASRGAAEEKAIAQLARSTGTYWLTASGSEQFASEFAALGHGVFTFAILEGLSGSADGTNNDKKITVKELSAYLDEKVPELSEQHKGEPQFPTIYGYGQDFPIGVIGE